MLLPNISATYSNSARQDGLYIEYDDQGSLKTVCLNGEGSSSLPDWIKKDVTFFNTVRPKIINTTTGQAEAENVLELNIKQLNQTGKINNGIIYVLRKNIRLAEAGKLPQNGLTVVSSHNVYLKGDYNTEDKQPASIITNSIVYFLSDDFKDFNEQPYLPAPTQPRDNPRELQYLNLDNFVPSEPAKMQALELQCERVFGLSGSFNIVTSPPTTSTELQTRIRDYYTQDHEDIMPDKTSPGQSKINTGVASPYDISFGYGEFAYNLLERWKDRSLSVTGAFTKLGSSWLNDSSGNPIRDVPKIYNSWVGRNGSEDIIEQTSRTSLSGQILIRGIQAGLKYDAQFETQKPPGDFRGSSESFWQEVSDFDHHTS